MFLMFKYDPEAARYIIASSPCDPTRNASHDDVKTRDTIFKNFVGEAKLHHGVKGEGFVDDCYAVAAGVDGTELDFHLRLVMAYWQLDPAARRAREAQAEAVFRTYFGRDAIDPGTLTVDTRSGPVPLLRMLVTVPDEMLEDTARLFCKIAAHRLMTAAPKKLPPKQLELLPAVTQRRALIDGMQASFHAYSNASDLMLVTECAWASRSIDDCSKLTSAAIRMVNTARGRGFLKTLGVAFETGGTGWGILALDAVASALQERLLTPAVVVDVSIAAWYVEQCDIIEQRRYQAAIEATLDAVRRGVDLGAFTAACKALMATSQLGSIGFDEKAMLKLLRQVVKIMKEQPLSPFVIRFKSERAVQSPWIRHAWRWAMDHLSQWCDGPIAQAGTQPLDAARICHDLNRGKPPPWTTDDVLIVIRVGLDAAMSRSALGLRFHYRATQHLMTESQRDHMASIIQEALDSDQRKFEREIVKTRDLLARANASMEAARRLIKPATDVDLAAFKAQAIALVRALPPEYTADATKPGHIFAAPAMDLAQWAAVFAALNDRWLPGVADLAVHDSLPASRHLALGAEATLALSVVAPMATEAGGHFFMVEAVLWRRRRGSVEPPTIEGHPDAPMDTRHWYSTLVPCARVRFPLADAGAQRPR